MKQSKISCPQRFRLTIVYPWVFVLALVCAAQLFGKNIHAAELSETELSSIDIYLWTFGMGPRLEERWGHNAIRVHNRATGRDAIYNMGIFDWSKPNFIYNFVKGFLVYRMGIFGHQSSIAYYRKRQRYIHENQVRLTAKQKQTLLDRLDWQGRPENIEYNYHYFLSNCSTKVRDFFDEALGGMVKNATSGIQTNKKYRHYVRDNLGTLPFIASSLDLIMNNEIDTVLSAWEEMFVPEKLKKHFLELNAVDDEGRQLDSPLLGQTRVVLDFSDVVGGTWHLGYLSFIFLPILFLLFAAKFGAETRVRLFGFALCAWALFSTIIGAALVFAWAWSLHTVLYQNANLMLLWPLDFFFIVGGVRLIFSRSWQSISPRLTKIMFWLAFLHLASVSVWVCAGLFGFYSQNTTVVALYLGPVACVVYGAVVYKLRNVFGGVPRAFG